jgi:hypothetical protein
VHDRVGLADVREELVAEPFAVRGTLHEAGDVHELDGGGNRFLRLDDLGEFHEACVGNLHHADVRLDGAEGIVGGFGLGCRERIEER